MGFESPHKNLEEQNKLAKERFEKLPEGIKDIVKKYNVNSDALASSSLRPEEIVAVEGVTEVPPKNTIENRATPHKRAHGGMTHAAIVAQKMEEKENKLD